VVIFDPNELKEEGQNETALSDDQSGEISGWWRRGRVELPINITSIKCPIYDGDSQYVLLTTSLPILKIILRIEYKGDG